MLNIEHSGLFGLGRSTVCTIINETCNAIATHLLQQYVQIPNGSGLRETIDGFEKCWGFPQTVGAIDGSHIPILRPQASASDYYNRKGFYSIIMQAVVDYRGRFLDVYIGWPGKVHDARVFVNSSLYSKGNNGTLLPNYSRTLSGVQVPLVILGDPAYPLLPWLMKPYPENAHTLQQQKHFNYRQSRARMVIENAFGRLKGRWRCLLKRVDCDLSNVSELVVSCVVLHNLCEMYGDSFLQEWTPNESSSNSSTVLLQHGSSSEARDIRHAIAEHLST